MNQSVKKWLCVGAGFGSGAVLMAGLLVAAIAWNASRPKAWNERALEASFDQFVYITNGNLTTENIGLEYVVTNSTSSDYVLSPDKTFMEVYKGALEHNPSYALRESTLIPARQKVRVTLVVPAAYNVSWQVDGFVLFDANFRYKLVFPKPTKPTVADSEARDSFVLDRPK